MTSQKKSIYKVCIIGIGYVGLPLFSQFSLKGFEVIGFDTNKKRLNELKESYDRNNDLDKKTLVILNKNSKLTSLVDDIKGCNIFIITVPTPINKDKTPNLEPIISASQLVGSIIQKNSIVIYESTVYPGVTDEVCTPILERASNLTCNKEFSTGYSPERIVPGDKINTIDKIKKVVSGSNPKALEIISEIYSKIIDAGIHKAPSIKVAEASKITENIQRDVNIALINEMHQLYSSLNINTLDVIEAASTKWNFMKLTPGLVGGHCISIDPYYLMHKSEMAGYSPNLMSTARKINDEMDKWVLKDFINFTQIKNINLERVKVSIFGYTFKENCPDTRNTKIKNLLLLIRESGIKVKLWDPWISQKDHTYLNRQGIETYNSTPKDVELAFVCVYHEEILDFLQSYKGLVYDYRDSTRVL
jgi:UDP-N-acetyl-D-galactosamine dehydrogenase